MVSPTFTFFTITPTNSFVSQLLSHDSFMPEWDRGQRPGSLSELRLQRPGSTQNLIAMAESPEEPRMSSRTSPRSQSEISFPQLPPAWSTGHIFLKFIFKINFLPLPGRYWNFNKMLLTSDTWDPALHPAQPLGEKTVLAKEESLGEVFQSGVPSCCSFYPRAKSKIPGKPEWDDRLREKTYVLNTS